MVKKLTQSLREYKKASIITPIFIIFEVILECIIPFIIANLVNNIQAGCGLDVIFQNGALLVVMACLSLAFGGLAGSSSATAACGFA